MCVCVCVCVCEWEEGAFVSFLFVAVFTLIPVSLFFS